MVVVVTRYHLPLLQRGRAGDHIHTHSFLFLGKEMVPRPAQSRTGPDQPRTAQDRPKAAQFAPGGLALHTSPRAAQDSPRTVQDRPGVTKFARGGLVLHRTTAPEQTRTALDLPTTPPRPAQNVTGQLRYASFSRARRPNRHIIHIPSCHIYIYIYM